jgi:hypothetical protein
MTQKVASRLSYLASTALLSSIISMTGAKAADVVPNPLMNTGTSGTLFPIDGVLKSPSGVYYATLRQNGSFVVSQGTDPATSGLNPVFSTPPAAPNSGGISNNGAVLENGTFGAVAKNGQSIFSLGKSNGGSSSSMLLTDSGDLSIANLNGPLSGLTFDLDKVNDPVAAYDLTGITYDLAHATISSTSQVSGEVDDLMNKTSKPEVFQASLSLSHTDMSNWNFNLSEAVKLGVKVGFDVGLPGIGDSKAEISIEETTTVGTAEGGSASDTKTFMAGASVTVPAHSYYQAVLTATKEDFTVPFSYSGDVTYQDGAVVPVDGSGMFTGTGTGFFQTAIICVTEPGGCEAGVGGDLSNLLPPGFLKPGEEVVAVLPATPVPEPSTWAMLLLGFGGLGFVGYRQTRKSQAATA